MSRDRSEARTALILSHTDYPERPMPTACTTAAAIRRNATEPAMEGIARVDRRMILLARIHAATRELAELAAADAADLRTIAGFTSSAAERLDHAERTGSYQAIPPIVSEMPNAKLVGARINAAIDALAGNAHDTVARSELHALFETFGADLLEQGRFLDRIGKNRLLALRGEFDRWRGTPRC